ncbi:hypothetical protein Tco_0651686 [Tanacetum coccineum]|uniref:Uncharacterized protein n=1 Tax=Tanacetum coccineum TaxID=301880 RepID=A0ABQ4WVM1_9ASTR
METYHNLWDIIVDGDLQEEAAPAGEQSGPPAPKTAKQLTAKRNQERTAIKSRFGGNDESKKTQRNVLKHQFENFTTAPNESLDKAYDRSQKLISQLEVHAAPVSKEDNKPKVPKKKGHFAMEGKSGKEPGKSIYGVKARGMQQQNEPSHKHLWHKIVLIGYAGAMILIEHS